MIHKVNLLVTISKVYKTTMEFTGSPKRYVMPLAVSAVTVWLCPDFILTFLVAGLIFESPTARKIIGMAEYAYVEYHKSYLKQLEEEQKRKEIEAAVEASVQSYATRLAKHGQALSSDLWKRLTV